MRITLEALTHVMIASGRIIPSAQDNPSTDETEGRPQPPSNSFTPRLVAFTAYIPHFLLIHSLALFHFYFFRTHAESVQPRRLFHQPYSTPCFPFDENPGEAKRNQQSVFLPLYLSFTAKAYRGLRTLSASPPYARTATRWNVNRRKMTRNRRALRVVLQSRR